MTKLSKFFTGFFTITVFLLSAGIADAVEKTGFINIQEIIRNTEVGKKAVSDIRKDFDKKKIVIQEKEDELKKLKDELDKQGPILTEKARREKEAAYQEKFNRYQQIVRDANEEIQNKQNDVLKGIIPDIMKIVKEIGKKEHFTLIIDVSVVPLAYHDETNDLTQRIVDEANRTLKPKK
ncbi:MAG: OmpH family outer membrane protein [Deltaproteobacteria bacterium]|nr:OmpH family outer membrane protein [Deltaproteobacteria bacterium]